MKVKLVNKLTDANFLNIGCKTIQTRVVLLVAQGRM